MKKVYIGSANPVKTESVKEAFGRAFPSGAFEFFGVKAESGVPRQPDGDQETFRGAMNRAEQIFKKYDDGDFWVGIEGGVEKLYGQMHAFAWVVVKSRETTGKARTATFPLPPDLVRLIEKGYELGEADDLFFHRTDSRQHDGTVGLLTKGLIDRKKYYEHAILLALVPLIQRDLFKKEAGEGSIN